jgi:hypothetical protein
MKMLLCITAAGLALAASLPAQIPPEQQAYQALQQLEQVRIDLTSAIPSSWEAPLISGHPYSAVAKTITRSPDGAHIDRSVSETIYRDDQGRTRRETNGGANISILDPRTRREINGGANISILDPAAGVAYNLLVSQKVAMKRALGPAMLESQTRLPNQSLLEIARAQAAARSNMTVEDLGTQVVSGVSAQGIRTTTTIPAGTFGNDRDLKTVVDRWVSTDLHILVQSVTTDSRSGPTTYELTNLVLGAPDPSLFQVPAGYTIQEGPGGGGRRGATQPVQPANHK